MKLSNPTTAFAALLALPMGNVLAAPIVNRRDAATPGGACAVEGQVVCNGASYFRCASGQWSTELLLAAGTDCSVWASFLDGSGPGPAVAPTTAAPAESASTTRNVVATPSTTSIIAASSSTGGKQISTAPAPAPTLAPTVAPAPTAAPAPSASPAAATPAAPASSAAAAGGFSGSSGANSVLAYQAYSGPATSFPDSSKWITFDHLWSLNSHVCVQLNGDANAQLIHDDILAAANEFQVDARVIFAVILQESTCNLNVPSTGYVVANNGLMQSHNGVSYDGTPASIKQMIADGTGGTYRLGSTLGGDGLQQTIASFGLYGGLRAYNSGNFGVNRADLSASGTGVNSYVSDIANRLVGAKIAT